MKTSESQTLLLAALLEAKRKFPKIEKIKEGQAGNRKFKYAPLEFIKDACDPILHELGLMVTQGPEGALLVTRLDHISGEWREIRMPMDEVYPSDQSYGISFSYRRRYSYQGILGIMTEEDVDGNTRKPAEKPGPKDLTKGGTVRHSPRSGIGDDLPEDWKVYLKDLAQECMELNGLNNLPEALDRISRANLDDTQRTYLENHMDSKTRSALKAIPKA
jgi:hypothetical protein